MQMLESIKLQHNPHYVAPVFGGVKYAKKLNADPQAFVMSQGHKKELCV